MNYSFTVPSLLILIIIIGYYVFRPRLRIRLNRAFLAILTIDLGTVVFDVISSLMDDHWTDHAPATLWIMNLLFFIFYFCRIYMFFVFTISVLDARGATHTRLFCYAKLPLIVCVVITLLSPLTGWIFTIDGEGYHPGPAYNLLYFCFASYVLFSLLAILRHRRLLSVSDLSGVVAMQLPLIAGNILRFVYPRFLIMNTFCLLSVLIIFLSFINPELFISYPGYIYNQQAFSALLLEHARRKVPCRILGFVLQNYAERRDFFGGQRMDEVLNRICRYLSSAFPQLSSFYLRNGCFAFVGPVSVDLDAVCAELERRFSQTWKTQTGELLLSISFLHVDTDLQSTPVDRLINTLLLALEEAGGAPRSTSTSHHDVSDSFQAINRRIDIRRCLERALEDDTLEVFLQPIVDSRSEHLVAAEALARLRDEAGEIIPPDQFITMAEREGYIVRLGEQVLTKVCRFIQKNDMKTLGIRWINVNLSPIQFLSRQVPQRFSEILQAHQVSPEWVHLEITEQSIADFSLLRDQIELLHARGFEFALDDYGSGYSNLSRVRQYPFTHIKIDMDITRDFCQKKDLLLPSMIQAFRQMNFSVTAEGIETREMADALREIGCEYFQGYYYSRPLPMNDFLLFAQTRASGKNRPENSRSSSSSS